MSTQPSATIAQSLSALADGDVTSRMLTEALLARIDQLNADVGAFLRLDRDGALAAADESDARRQRGESAGALDGVVVGLKDLLVTRGLETTAASRILEGFVPPYDGTAVRKLREAGAILIGKLNMDEFAMGSSNEHSVFGPTRNPWDLDRVPGGSSGGSAAAVAAGMCPATLGTDTGGSIRQPASLCGVSGLKPTYGRVSRYGVIAFASSLDQVGPIAQTVDGTARVLQVIAGHDPKDATSARRAVPDFLAASQRDVAGLRLGVPAEYFGAGIDPQVEDAVRAAISRLEALGASVVEVSLPHTRFAVAAYYLVATAEASSNLARYDGVRYGHRSESAATLEELYSHSRAEGFGDEVKRRIMLGTYALSAGYYDDYYVRALKVRSLIRADFLAAFEHVDALVCPTSPTTAFRMGERTQDPLTMYLGDILTIPCNLAGLPGLSVPCGFDDDGLPIGLQVLGAPFDEASVLSVGGAYQRATDWHERRPSLGSSAS